MDIKLNSVRHDEESSYKSTQSVAELEYTGNKIKAHFYHTNQTCLIQGPSHEDFYEKFLIPMIGELIQLRQDKIRWFNNLIIRTIMPGPASNKTGFTRAGVRRPPSGSQDFNRASTG